MIKPNSQSGVTLVETLFYLALFSLLSLIVITALITMTRSFKETTVAAQSIQATNTLERIAREIRQSNTATIVSGTDLQLAQTDKTVEFYLSGTDLQLFEDGTLIGNLNSADISVNSLSFTKITTTKSTAIKISMSFQVKSDTQNKTEDLYDTITLREGYAN